ncbi:hypothetical protein HPB51_011396 [Rhipicephalus microplus]|uniref:Uncharacterized protein n=1 Tax=Rhipicephalus microplus TaxID=6941 RepID=A0A9J6F377_RHIMP|nr:hypothetical protein HPB51_011396 [Rhipicephalus microplus]
MSLAMREKGAACLRAKFDEVLVDIFYYLEKSAKQKDRLVEFQGMHNTEVRKILKHVPTRWLSLGRCLTRLLEQWQPLVSFFLNETDKVEKPAAPKLSGVVPDPQDSCSFGRCARRSPARSPKTEGAKRQDLCNPGK